MLKWTLLTFKLLCPLVIEWFRITFVLQSVSELFQMRKKNIYTGNWFHVLAFNRRSKFFGVPCYSATNHYQKWKTVKCCNKKEFVTKELYCRVLFLALLHKSPDIDPRLFTEPTSLHIWSQSSHIRGTADLILHSQTSTQRCSLQLDCSPHSNPLFTPSYALQMPNDP